MKMAHKTRQAAAERLLVMQQMSNASLKELDFVIEVRYASSFEIAYSLLPCCFSSVSFRFGNLRCCDLDGYLGGERDHRLQVRCCNATVLLCRLVRLLCFDLP